MPVTDRVVLAGIAGALVLAAVAAWLLLAAPSTPRSTDTDPFAAVSSVEPAPSASGKAPAELVVDVEGAVVEPGIRGLPDGARVADAIRAAGGYAADADLAASAHALNLAAPLADGDQVYVPRLGDGSDGGQGGTGGGSGGGTDSGLVNLNTASSDALDALPGIGPATIAKILAARSDQPFRTLDELVERKVLTASQLAGIRDRVTV
jgi:competence protein ComEA